MKAILMLFLNYCCLVAKAQLTPPAILPASNAVDALYINILKRYPEKQGMDYFTSFLNECKGDRGLRDVIARILASDEYKITHFYGPLVNYAYKVILERAPEKQGSQYFSNRLVNGGSTKDLYQYILHSEEFEKKYAQTLTPADLNAKLCLIILGRSPQNDPSLNFLKNEISGKGYRSAVNTLLNSAEFAKRFGKLGSYGNDDIIRNFIANLFQDLLQHPPAPGDYFVAVQQNGLDAAINGVLYSDEYNRRFGDWLVPANPVKYRLQSPPCRQKSPIPTRQDLSVRGTMLEEKNGLLYFRPTDSMGNCTLDYTSIALSKVLSRSKIGTCTLISRQSGSITRDLYEIIYTE